MSNEFIMGQGQGHQIELAGRRNWPSQDEDPNIAADLHWLSVGTNIATLRHLRLGRAELVMKPQTAIEVATPPDTLIRVDRSVRPVYPDFIDRDYINTPEFIALERSGPSQYHITEVQQWLHQDQEDGVVGGSKIHEYLKKKDRIKSCLGLHDLIEIQKKGIAFYRQYFNGKVAFGWRSVAQDRNSRLDVPFLAEDGGEVVLRWSWLGHDWHSYNPALRFDK